jgi:hypothetical protein
MKIQVVKVWTDNDAVYILTGDGDVFGERFADYSRLATATTSEREHFECDNIGIHWGKLDEDLSYRGFMTEGKRIRSA